MRPRSAAERPRARPAPRRLAAAGGRRRARPGHQGARGRRRSRAGERATSFLGLDLTNVRNTGRRVRRAARAAGRRWRSLIAAALALLVGYFVCTPQRRWLWLPAGLLLGGALGNLLDRARDGRGDRLHRPALWPAFNVADVVHHDRGARAALVLERAARRRRGHELDGPAGGGRASASTRFLAGPRRLARAAQRLIDAGRVRVDGARAAEAPSRRRRRARRGRRRRRAASAAAARRAPFEIVYEDEHLLVVDKPAGVVVHPRRGHRGGTLAQALAGRAAGGEDPGARRASCTASTATRRACSSWPSPTRRTRRCRRARGAREVRARVPGAGRGPPAGAHAARSTRRSAATAASARAMSTDTDEPREAVTHFDGRARAARAPRCCACGSRPGRTHQIRAHLAGDRPPGLRRPRVRRRAGRLRPRAPVPARRRAWCLRTRRRGSRWTPPRRCPSDLAAALERATRTLTPRAASPGSPGA